MTHNFSIRSPEREGGKPVAPGIVRSDRAAGETYG
jgi:hypothetical protein